MTRRILAGFLAVLVVVITAIIVPLGLIVTAQRRHDFTDSARAAARSLATLAEEQLDDHDSAAALPGLLATAASPGDRVAVLDRAGTLVATTAMPPGSQVVVAVQTGRPVPQMDGLIVVTAAVGEGANAAGTVILARDSSSLRDRARDLWLALSGAALLALILGALVGWSLGRWITRPLRSLITTAHGIGAGHPHPRVDPSAGPVQVREVAHAFNDMADRIATLLRTQRGMTAEVSHQLRTPLAALRLRLELLATSADGEARNELTAMLAETNRLTRLLDGLLAIARAEAIEPAPVQTDLAQAISERLEAWEPVAAERQITLQQRTPAAPVMAALTPGHLEQILDNLLANAIEAIPSRGRITVSASRGDEHILLRVDDTGPGMTQEQRVNAFDPFSTDRSGRGGTGLGLAIVGRLVATDHGSATLHPGPGRGTRVEIKMRPARPPASTKSPSNTPTR